MLLSGPTSPYMVRLVTILWFVIAVTLCPAQATPSTPKPALSKFSSERLKACYDDKAICGARDVFEISDELTKRLPTFSTDQLIACLKNWKACGVENDIETGWAVSKELARRGDPHKLLIYYWTEPDILVREGIVHAAYQMKTPEVTEFMRRVLAVGQGDEDTLYWPADYLAMNCDADGLKWLRKRHGRPEGCIIWAPTVALFGKCNYRQAIPYLVDNSIRDACLDIVDEGVKDLQHFFPHSPKEFNGMEEMQDYFCARAKREGLHVDCDSK